MKIGFFTDSYLPRIDGVAISVDTCARELEARGHTVYIIAPSYPGFKDKKNVFRLTSVKVPKQPELRLAMYLPGKSLIQLSKIDFDIIHGHSGGPVTFLGWEVALLKKVPFVCTYHTLWNKYTHYFLNGKLIPPKMTEVASRVFCNMSDSLIAPTMKVKDELISYGVQKPIAVIPNGLDLEKFQNVKKGFLRKRLKLKSTDKILLYVGRLGKEKSVDFLIRSFALVSQKRPDTVLVIVGDGPEREKLQDLARSLLVEQRIYFTGSIEQKFIALVYADAALFLFASRTETQGMVILEAMASSLPIIARKDLAFEGIIENGKNGILVRNNQKEFSRAIINLLYNSQEMMQLSLEAHKKAELFSIDATVDGLEKLYKTVILQDKNRQQLPLIEISS